MKRTLIGLLTLLAIVGILFSGCVEAPPEAPAIPPEAPVIPPEPPPEAPVIPPEPPPEAPSLPIEMNLITSESPTLGRSVGVTARFHLETGYQDAHDITVRIILPEGFEKIGGDPEWKGDIIRDQYYSFKARVKAIKAGTWEIAAQADSKSGDMVGYATLSVSVPDIVFNLPDNLFPPPWLNVNYYFDANKTIIAKGGEEFTIGFDTFTRGGEYWNETHDEKMISLVDSQILEYPPAFNPATTWFLFKALQAGETKITFKYYGPAGQLREPKVFNIEIE